MNGNWKTDISGIDRKGNRRKKQKTFHEIARKKSLIGYGRRSRISEKLFREIYNEERTVCYSDTTSDSFKKKYIWNREYRYFLKREDKHIIGSSKEVELFRGSFEKRTVAPIDYKKLDLFYNKNCSDCPMYYKNCTEKSIQDDEIKKCYLPDNFYQRENPVKCERNNLYIIKGIVIERTTLVYYRLNGDYYDYLTGNKIDGELMYSYFRHSLGKKTIHFDKEYYDKMEPQYESKFSFIFGLPAKEYYRLSSGNRSNASRSYKKISKRKTRQLERNFLSKIKKEPKINKFIWFKEQAVNNKIDWKMHLKNQKRKDLFLKQLRFIDEYDNLLIDKIRCPWWW